MELNEYQKQAMNTCMESSNNFSYMMLNLVGEVGEFASKVAKHIRKDGTTIDENVLKGIPQDENGLYSNHAALREELGDILWQVAGLAHVMGWDLEEVAYKNIKKLASRQKRNVIDGNGDNR